ncbi:MAG TPA: penicillin-insensitive murein endopeptidase [Polyangia bacterium]|jgi:penicillin-insensitive murein endopeptidase|nr:penicillin-insensitive murein endopeptidase [Polyangia bacterium]
MVGMLGGCSGPLAFDGSSVSIGATGDGTVRSPVELPVEGDGYTVPARWRLRHSNFGTDELVGVVVRAARAVARALPGGTAAIGDLSRRAGGSSIEHKSHQSGRDVDVFFYAVDGVGRPVAPGEAMIRYGVDGQALRWSPAHGFAPPAAPLPAYRFDAGRNWAFVRALLTDEDTEVQWIFIQRDLAALLLRAATGAGEDPALVARAAFILHEPTDSEPHDDHMHVRLYCDPADRRLGCADRGPVRWWKKEWKYMAPPYGRDDGRRAAAARAAAAVRDGELPVSLGAGALRG